jgi:leucyl-tRNA synthetase
MSFKLMVSSELNLLVLIEAAKEHARDFLVNLTIKKTIVVSHRQLINLVVG